MPNKEYVRRLELGAAAVAAVALAPRRPDGRRASSAPGCSSCSRDPTPAGKGGAIKRVVQPLDPRHYRVSTYSKPTFDEKRHHFLRRFYQELPGLGGHGRVRPQLVRPGARRADRGLRHRPSSGAGPTRRSSASSARSRCEGLILVKFWLHISDDEQLRRFERRAEDPLRRWKITDEDWRNRKRNRTTPIAAEEMFERTDHRLAPWDLVGANQKKFARVPVLEILNDRIEAGMRRWGTPVPKMSEVGGFDVE